MEILFDRSYPKYFVEAIQLIQKMDTSGWNSVSYYDTKTKDAKLIKPVLIRIDRERRGLETITQTLFESGISVLAIKLPSKKSYTLYEFSLTMIKLWPKLIHVIKENDKPFIYKCMAKTT